MTKIYKNIIGISLLSCLLSTSTALANELPTTGKGGPVEWQTTQSWKSPAGVIDFVHSLDGKLVYFLTSDEEVKAYTSSGIYQGSIPVPKGVNNIDIAPLGETLYLVNSDTNIFTSLSIDFVVDVDVSGSPQLGDADAPVSIIVFTDFECPYCSKLAPMIEQVYNANQKNVLITFKNMPLNFHKHARKAALVGLAVDKQGHFWEYHDKIFALKTLNDKTIMKTAKTLGLDMAQLQKDIASPAIIKQLDQDMAQATKAGVTGTPTVYINGRKLKKRTLQTFQATIDEELRKAGLL